MKITSVFILVSLIFFGISVSGMAADTLHPQDDLHWLVGNWTGKAFGGTGEEVWHPMSAGTMVGTYKQIINGEVKFYEFMLIEKNGDSYNLKLKHFNPDMTGWEEKDKYVSFPYIKSGTNFIEFDGLSFYLKENGDLEIKVSIRQKDGSVEEVVSNFSKKSIQPENP